MFRLPVMVSAKIKFYALIGVIVMMSHFSISSSELVHYNTCGDTNTGSKDSCTISNVAIDPCPEARDNETCNTYKGTNVSITFDFYPPFTANDFKTAVYSSTLLVDIPDIEHDRDGCKYSPCPIMAGKKHSFKSIRYMKPVYPTGPYLVKYRMWHESSKNECCFLININIV